MDSFESDDEFDYDNALQNSGSDSSSESFSDSSSTSSSLSNFSEVRSWCRVNSVTPAPPPFPFTANPKVNFDVDGHENVLQFFEKFFDDALINNLVTETNRYMDQHIRGEPTHTSSNEMRVFLTLTILQSIVKKPAYRHYWTKNPLLSTPIFPQCMTGKRFEVLKQFLHFSNNEEFDADTHPAPKLNKIWPIYENLVTKFQNLCTPEQKVTIDESLLLYKGRLGWIQYIPLKRARFGIKTYLLCESKSGYIWNFIIYTGKNTLLDREFQHLPVSSQVVMTLMRPLLNKGYCLTMDNFYNSPQLADLLISKQTDVYGTLRATRKEVPKELKNKKLNKGEIIAYQRGKVTVLKWKDKKDVALISTVHSMATQEVVVKGERIQRPTLVIDYNDTMGGVDRVDQHLSDYVIPRKRGKKYYKKIFFHLLDFALWNSFILYQKTGGRKSALDYRMDLVKQMLEKYLEGPVKVTGRPSIIPPPMRLSARHFPDFIPPTERKANPTRQCVICCRKRDERGKRVRKETRYQCPDCDVPLCVVPCFKTYHTSASI